MNLEWMCYAPEQTESFIAGVGLLVYLTQPEFVAGLLD